MHQAQRRALLAMVDSIENQCRYVKSILLIEDEAANQEETRKRPQPSGNGSTYLDEKEEKELADRIEQARQAEQRENLERTQGEWSKLRDIAEQETPKPLIG